MVVTAGARLRSQVDGTEVIVIRPPSTEAELCCGGYPLVPTTSPRTELLPPSTGLTEGTVLGKRYFDSDTGLELLCVRPGTSALTAGSRPLRIKAAEALPASD